jgi:hypothetical protein
MVCSIFVVEDVMEFKNVEKWVHPTVASSVASCGTLINILLQLFINY